MSSQAVSTSHIAYLEKDFLDGLGGRIDSSALTIDEPREPRLLRIKGVSNFWELQKEQFVSLRLYMEDIISGLYEGGIPIVFGAFGRADRIDIVIGTFARGGRSGSNTLETLKTAMRSSFQGIELEELEPSYLGEKLSTFQFSGLVTGTPTGTVGDQEKVGKEQIERIIRGLYGREWGYVVLATPATNEEINGIIASVLNEMRVVADSQKSSGVESPIGKRYNEELELYLKRKLQLAKAQGMWHAAVFLLSKDEETLNHTKAVVRSALSGRESIPDPIRTLELQGAVRSPGLILNRPPAAPGQFQYPYGLMNTLNSVDLADFIHLPSQEMPGFKVKPYSRFNVSVGEDRGDAVNIGEIWDQGRQLGIQYGVSPDSLKKHGLIVGTTGSGKSNTLFHILREAWRRGIPFLVIEPAKTEYRKLLMAEELRNDLHVFTLGNNNVSPFRINPFEILPGVSVQTHIDLLKSVFNASFYMWGILPQVLERCIHEVYTDKGWDLAANSNLRGIHRNASPTLTDLYAKVDEVVDSLGYSGEVTMDLGSALKTRINSLRIGGKGLMLDTRNSIPLSMLMSKPVVLELEPIGNDEEKAFLMGLILAMMYETYISRGVSEGKALTHITVIEEAHRLLANYAVQGAYQANVKGQAVEAFTNILSEIRAYGEGFLIAEQIPTKLSPDVIKNTNLKIMHRIVAEDDRKVMGATMNIEARETKAITALGVGEAAVYSEGDSGAYHAKVPYSKIEAKEGAEKDDAMVVKAMEEFDRNAEHFAPFQACVTYCKSICRYKALGETVGTRHRFASQIPCVVLSLVEEVDPVDHLAQMMEVGREEGRTVEDPMGIRVCSIIQASDRYFESMGSRYRWPYDGVDELEKAFLRFYKGALDAVDGRGELSEQSLDASEMTRFRDLYLSLCSGRQPTELCSDVCPDDTCRYRFTLSGVLADDHYHKRFVETINERKEDMWEALYAICREAAETALPKGKDETIRKMALCFALQKSHAIESFNRRHIWTVMENLTETSASHAQGGDPSEMAGFEEGGDENAARE